MINKISLSHLLKNNGLAGQRQVSCGLRTQHVTKDTYDVLNHQGLSFTVFSKDQIKLCTLFQNFICKMPSHKNQSQKSYSKVLKVFHILLSNEYYRRYHTITDVYTTALLLTKHSSDDDSGFRHDFGAEVSLPLAHSISQHHQTLSNCCRSIGLPDPR